MIHDLSIIPSIIVQSFFLSVRGKIQFIENLYTVIPVYSSFFFFSIGYFLFYKLHVDTIYGISNRYFRTYARHGTRYKYLRYARTAKGT